MVLSRSLSLPSLQRLKGNLTASAGNICNDERVVRSRWNPGGPIFPCFFHWGADIETDLVARDGNGLSGEIPSNSRSGGTRVSVW